MKIISKEKAKEYIYKSNGKFFSAVFIKKNGETRFINCRTKVSKYVKGVGLSFNPQNKGYMTVFDLIKGEYRFINLNTLKELKINGKQYQIKEKK